MNPRITNQSNSKNYRQADDARIVHSGNDFFDSLETIINTAKHTIHLQTYIFDEDETGNRISDALIAAASRGVQVFVVLDGYGSKTITKKFIKKLADAGIHFRFFSSLSFFQKIYIGRRLHHKIVVADKHTALIGGINISDKYRGTKNNLPWLDYALFIKGNYCEEANKICHQVNQQKFFRKRFKANFVFTESGSKNILVQLRENDRLRRKNQIAASYIREIRNAKQSITIVASYFLPGAKLKRALLMAARRGVKVNIILSGISDIPIFRLATSFLYGIFLHHKINIYEWKKSVLHGKAAVIDNRWTTVGSFNLNHLSAFGSIELNVDVLDELLAQSFNNHLNDIIKNGCEKIEMKTYRNHSSAYNIKRAIAYFLTRTAIKILALFPKIFSLSAKKYDW